MLDGLKSHDQTYLCAFPGPWSSQDKHDASVEGRHGKASS